MLVNTDFAIGIALILTAAVMFGAHTSFAKMDRVLSSNVAMPIYNTYFLIGLSCACFLDYSVVLFMGETVKFTYLGIIFAIIILFSELFILLSTAQVGIAYSMGFTIFSSSLTAIFIQLLFGHPIANLWMMCIALFVLANCIFFMSTSKYILLCLGCLKTRFKSNDSVFNIKQNIIGNIDDKHSFRTLSTVSSVWTTTTAGMDETTPLMYAMTKPLQSMESSSSNYSSTNNILERQPLHLNARRLLLGFLYSSVAGIFFATAPFPTLYAGEFSSGLKFFLSAGIGCLMVIPLSACMILVTYSFVGNDSNYHGSQFTDHGTTSTSSIASTFYGFMEMKKTPNDSLSEYQYENRWHLLQGLFSFKENIWHFKEVFWPAFCAGIVWGLGNIAGLYSFLLLEYIVSSSIVQLHAVVSILLAIFVFKEIQTTLEIGILFVLSLLLVASASVVVISAYGAFGI